MFVATFIRSNEQQHIAKLCPMYCKVLDKDSLFLDSGSSQDGDN